MKYKIIVTAALLSLALAAPAAAGNDIITDAYTFRGLEWGSSMTDIIEAETRADMTEDDYEIGATYYALKNIEVVGHSAVAVFYLDGDTLGLESGAYSLTEYHADSDEYIKDFKSIVETYGKKYGSPAWGRVWKKGSIYKDEPDLEGAALTMGDVKYFADWKAEDGSRIEIDMFSEDYTISTTIYYYSPDYTEPKEEEYDVFADDNI